MKELQKMMDGAVEAVIKKFTPIHLRPDEMAVSFVDLAGDACHPVAHFRGDTHIYPASVIKLFYLAATHQWLEDKKITDTNELRRALHDMIVHSGNEATGYIVDILTDTTSGPELPSDQLAAWHEKRNAVNRYFGSLGYADINANRKTWNDGPYGRDKQAVDQFMPARNFLTTNATARLAAEIAKGICVTTVRCEQMLDLMKRDFTNPNSQDYQAREFTGLGLPPTAKLWSKAGDMSAARHDAAIVELENGSKFVLVTFTTRPDSKEIIPEMARQIIGRLPKITAQQAQ